MKLDTVKSEQTYAFWDSNDDRNRIIIHADSSVEAVQLLGEFLLKLRTQKVDFNRPKEQYVIENQTQVKHG